MKVHTKNYSSGAFGIWFMFGMGSIKKCHSHSMTSENDSKTLVENLQFCKFLDKFYVVQCTLKNTSFMLYKMCYS